MYKKKYWSILFYKLLNKLRDQKNAKKVKKSKVLIKVDEIIDFKVFIKNYGKPNFESY